MKKETRSMSARRKENRDEGCAAKTTSSGHKEKGRVAKRATARRRRRRRCESGFF